MKKLILSSFAIVLCASLLAQTGTNLRMNLEKNKVYRFRSTSAQTITQSINGNQQTVDSKSDYTMSLKMIDATPDFMITEVHIDTMKTSTNSMGQASNMSSAVEGNVKSTVMGDVMSYFMNRFCKNALYVKMDFTGKPIEIVNSKMLSEMVLKDTGSIALTGPMALGVKKQVISMVSDNAMKTLIQMFTNFLPAKPLAGGDSWNINTNMSSGGMQLVINTTYHLDGINGDLASVSTVSEIKPAENAEPIVSGPAKVTYDDLKGISKASLIIDTKTGLLTENKGKTHITGNLGVTAPGMSMQMPMDINGESKIIAIK